VKGGARSRSGPAPDPNALRRDRDGGDWVTLPAEGRKGTAPDWPLADESKREVELWRREWKRPQAVMWEQNGQEIEVAMYVRTVMAAEKKDAPANMRTLLKQQQEALGLSLPGLSRNRWKIEHETEAESETRQPVVSSAKDRFGVIPGGRAA
jgi:hypothetical protein